MILKGALHHQVIMREGAGSLYRDFGGLVKAHRKRLKGMTQAKLGNHVGLSRTSVNNIEKGRHHASLHHLFAIADALQVSPEALLPDRRKEPSTSNMATLLPAGMDKGVVEWAERLVGGDHGKTTD